MATVEIINETPVKYVQLNDEKMPKIFQEHILNGRIVEESALVIGSETAY